MSQLIATENTVSDPTSAMTKVAQSASAQQVQAAIIMAKQCPRDTNTAYTRIMESCKRVSLAEQSTYAYPRGGKMVTGPSIRMAETLAQCWGNLDFGIVEVDQKDGESTVMSFCWDLETNTRQVKTFTVKHERHTKKGVTKLSDPRDIYELVANQGARRLRACILGIIPGDIVEEAGTACQKTLSGGSNVPLQDRVRAMVAAFKEKGVTQEQIEKRLGHNLDSVIEPELISLRQIYQSIKDGMASPSDFFSVPKATEPVDDVSLEIFGDESAESEAPPAPAKEESKKETKPLKTHDEISKMINQRSLPSSLEDLKGVVDESANGKAITGDQAFELMNSIDTKIKQAESE